MNPFLMQSITLDPQTIEKASTALQDAGIAIVAIVAMVVAVFILARIIFKALAALEKNAAALDKISDRIAAGQDRDEREKERTRTYIETTGETIDKMKNAVVDVQSQLSKQIEDTTARIAGKDGVLEQLKSSIIQISDLGLKTQAVIESANSISANLESIKEGVGKMNVSDDEVKRRIEAIQDQLKDLTGAVSSIPAAVGDAERNIIAVIEKRADPGATRPLPDITQIVKAHNGAEKEKEDVENTQAAD